MVETLTLKQLSEIIRNQDYKKFRYQNEVRKIRASSILVLFDMGFIALSMLLSFLLRDYLFDGTIIYNTYNLLLVGTLPIFTFLFFLRKLYPGYGINSVEELKSLTLGSTLIYALIATCTFLIKDEFAFSRFVLVSSWLTTLVILPLGRLLVKKYLASKNWWGIPIIIIGANNISSTLIKFLQLNKHLGLNPVVTLDDDSDNWGYIYGVPVIGPIKSANIISKQLNIETAIVTIEANKKNKEAFLEKLEQQFNSILLISDMYGVWNLWGSSKDLGGLFGFELKQNLFRRSSFIQKRMFDVIVSSLLLILISPILVLIFLLIKIDSKGKVIFKQNRVGYKGESFAMYKFRTMHIDAEKRLETLLKTNESYRKEFEIYHKIKDDPRITRVGKWLRKYSLDELPQFFNVLLGQMSLIGPRARLSWEMSKTYPYTKLILSVKPGISGFWQVTYRNESSFDERTYLDVYYIRNWSFFMDIYIFFKTIAVIFKGNG